MVIVSRATVSRVIVSSVIVSSDEGPLFSQRFSVEQNIRKYSNFVGFPIYVDDERVNTVEVRPYVP